LNNIIDDAMYLYSHIDNFAMYLANTINLEDNIKMMQTIPEFNQIINADLSNIPIEDVKNIIRCQGNSTWEKHTNNKVNTSEYAYIFEKQH
jgi:hypothetical protein